jgi:release factor glutamine methyltransferase
MGSDGTPSQVVTFMGVDLETSPGVLIPREETATLGRAAINILESQPADAKVVDMCCGSGNLACALALAQPLATVWASDLTDESVSLTWRNVERLGLELRVHVRRGDLFASLAADHLQEHVDLIVCNPPYISTSRLAGEKSYLLAAEPKEAFDGGPYGLSIHQRVLREALSYLRRDGWIALEFGQGQERQVGAIIARMGQYGNVSMIADPTGLPRVAIAQKIS